MKKALLAVLCTAIGLAAGCGNGSGSNGYGPTAGGGGGVPCKANAALAACPATASENLLPNGRFVLQFP